MQGYLKELNDEQLAAVEHEGTPLLILAGAGSGKTKTLTYKVAHLLDTGVATPEEVLLVTFTNKAAGEMKERVARVSQRSLSNVGTFHSLAARILRRSGIEVGVAHDFVIYDDQDQEDLVKHILEHLRADPKRFRPRAIMSSISGAKQEMLESERYQDLARGPFQEMVASVYREYQQRLRKANALDFDDLLLEVVRLFSESHETRHRYQDMLRYVFVDEYQDTNGVQYAFTKLLADRYKQLTVVGDASQSIYKWRGADYRNMARLKADYPNLTELKLTRNYRSTQTILDAATDVIGNNKNHPILPLWTDSGAGEKVQLFESYSAADEAKRVAGEVERLTREGFGYRDIAILYRTNSQSRAFEEQLIRMGIPYVLVGGTKFYERKEVKDVLSYVRVVLNPEDEVSMRRVEKLGKGRLSKLTAWRDSYNLEGKGAAEVLAQVLFVTTYLDRYDEEIEEDLSRIENVRELQAVATEFGDIPSFLENVALVQSEYYADEKSKKDKNAITLMTLHAAKGLEFPTVFIVGLEEGLFPHSRSLMDREEMEEERRLMYVGITRAKEKLYLSYAKSRAFWGSSGPQMRSRFVDEIDPNLLESFRQPGQLLQTGQWISRSSGQPFGAPDKTKKSGIRIDALSDETLDDFLSGNLSVEELLSR